MTCRSHTIHQGMLQHPQDLWSLKTLLWEIIPDGAE